MVPSVRQRERAINLPVPVLVAMAMLLAVHLVRTALDPDTDIELLLALAFVPAPWSVALGVGNPDGVVAAAKAAAGDNAQLAAYRGALATYVLEQGVRPWSALTYAFLHGSWSHLGLNELWLAAFGAPVVRRAGAARSGLLALATALGGALAAVLADPLGVQPIIGASAIVSGAMGAGATFLFSRAETGSRWSFLRERGPVMFVAIWLVANGLTGVLAGPLGLAEGGIAWQAHIGGLVAGLLLFPLLDPARSAHH